MSPSRAALSVLALTSLVLAGTLLPGSLGAWAIYAALGLFPGLALARIAPLEGGRIARNALGLAIAPLASASCGWALIAAGMPIPAAARLVAALGWGAWVWLTLRGPAPAEAPEPGARFAIGWAVGAALVVALPLFANPYLRVRSDAWVHGGIVWEILERGIPPQDPRFAGLPLNYVWFFNLFVAMATALKGGDPFVFMAIFDSVNLAATMLLAWTIGRRLWDARAAAGCAMLLGLGFNAGVWLLWPLRLLRALVGHDRGWPEVARELSGLHLRSTDVIFSLSAPFAYMASFLDKFLLGTALNYGYLMMTLYLWALVAWLDGGGRAALVWAAAAAAGMLLFHGVVGLSVVPVMMGVLVVAALAGRRASWLPSPSRLLWFASASLVGALAAAPYTLAISRGWAPERSGLRHSYFGWDRWMLWTLVSAIAVALWIARRPLRQVFVERRAAAAVLALFAGAMGLFAAVVKLPSMNHVKFVHETFVPIALIGGPALVPEVRGWAKRFGWPVAIIGFSLVFAGPPALTLFGYLSDRAGRTAPETTWAPGEPALCEWIRRETPATAVLVDNQLRPALMVRARRQLLLGSKSGPEMAAFPLAQVEERRAVMTDLYGPLAAPERDVAVLGRLGRPVYVLYRRADFATGPFPGDRVAGDAGRFASVYDRDGFVLYRLALDPPATP